jgi:very-short-patch-repair endonuclease
MRRRWIFYGSTSTIDKIERRLARGYFKTDQQQLQARNLLYKFSLEKRPTKAELLFGDYLYDSNVRFLFQKGFFKPFHRIYDFYIPGRKIAFEIDGSSHHGKEAKDARRDRFWWR